MQVSKVEIDDLSIIRVINDEAIPAVNSVSVEEFVWFHKNSIYFKKVSLDESLAGFLLVLPMNIPYKSLNYTWFSKRYDNFAYIDRIAVKEEFKGSGIGTLLYTDLEKSLPKGIKMIACEYNIKPLNMISKNFHQKMSYKNVGTQLTENNTKQVSLMVKEIND
jgi:predicted GNAT superfamily acetyltransferase